MRLLMKLIGAKYMIQTSTGMRYFWRLCTAIEAIEKYTTRGTVRTLNWKPVHRYRGSFTATHQDANNFNPYQ